MVADDYSRSPNEVRDIRLDALEGSQALPLSTTSACRRILHKHKIWYRKSAGSPHNSRRFSAYVSKTRAPAGHT